MRTPPIRCFDPIRALLQPGGQGIARDRSGQTGALSCLCVDAINNPLSVNRAASTRDYLTARGVGVSRISIAGRGSHEPVADNDTVSGRAMNHRVEIFVAEPEAGSD